jgi:hypothetical protein
MFSFINPAAQAKLLNQESPIVQGCFSVLGGILPIMLDLQGHLLPASSQTR